MRYYFKYYIIEFRWNFQDVLKFEIVKIEKIVPLDSCELKKIAMINISRLKTLVTTQGADISIFKFVSFF